MTDTKHTPAPWKVSENAYGCFFIQHGEGRAMSLIAGGNNHDTLSGVDADHIVKCVNMHDELVEALKVFALQADGRKSKGINGSHCFSQVHLLKAREAIKKAGAL